MASEYVTKGQAVSIVNLETGRGRRVIENMMDALVAQGRISILPDPLDKRSFRVSRTDVDTVIQVIKAGGVISS
jgi:hypothetical protein